MQYKRIVQGNSLQETYKKIVGEFPGAFNMCAMVQFEVPGDRQENVEKNVLSVYPIGMDVLLGDDIAGRIVGIAIRPGNFAWYQVEWWSGRERKSEWLETAQFRLAEPVEMNRIGFHAIACHRKENFEPRVFDEKTRVAGLPEIEAMIRLDERKSCAQIAELDGAHQIAVAILNQKT